MDNLGDLQKAIELCQESVESIPPCHENLALCNHNLSVHLFSRFRRTGSHSDLEFAIERGLKAFHGSPKTNPNAAIFAGHLVVLYLDKYQAFGVLDDLESAARLNVTCLRSIGDGDANSDGLAAENYSNLAAIYSLIYNRPGGLKNRDAIMQWNHAAANATRSDDPELHIYKYKLSLQYLNRYIQLREVEDLDLSIKLGNEAFALAPSEHPSNVRTRQVLADAYTERYSLLRETDDREHALRCFRVSLDTSNGDPSILCKVAQRWAAFAERHDLRHECFEAYAAAYRIMPELFWLGSVISSRHETLVKHNVSSVTTKAIAACIRFNNLPLAVEFLEQSLALTFQQLLDLQTDLSALNDKFPQYSSMLEKISTELKTIAISTDSQDELLAGGDQPSQRGRQRKLAMERVALIKTIRQIPDFETFLLPVPFKFLVAAADRSGYHHQL
jgi:tetratricopeptide (TPR) repeat protein